MANELKHSSVGTICTQTEFEAVGLHVLNSQATGDLIYASSSSQLSRFAIGNGVLYGTGGTPTWATEVANITLNTAVAKGTWTASGTWTVPAHTLGGTVTGNSQTITTCGDIQFVNGNAIYAKDVGNTLRLILQLAGDNSVNLVSAAGNNLIIYTDNASGAGHPVKRLEIISSLATATASWTNCAQVFDANSLPSSNPGVVGQLYYVAATGVVMRSAG